MTQMALDRVIPLEINFLPFYLLPDFFHCFEAALNIRESDFWQPGTRAVMFSQPASQLLAGARMDVYVIRDGEGN